MRYFISQLTATAIVAILISHTVMAQSVQTKVPPKGWNSWDSYGMYPTQEAMLANMEVMAKRLKPFGYEYFVIDAGWNKVKDAQGKIITMSLDNYGRYIPNKETFPGGIKAVADRAHALGLKFGIHIMRGISRIAYRKNMPVLGTKYTARDIADTTSLCKWNHDNYGINMKKPGAQQYYDSYIALLVSWGIDFIKADDIAGHPDEIDAVISAIRKTGKPVVLSLSPGGDSRPEYFQTYKQANMLRVTRDVWDDQIGIDRVFTAWKQWSNIDHDGFWLDMDMIPFGHLCLHNPDKNYLTAKPDPNKHGVKQSEHISFFNADQKYTFMAMRALSASPLFMGGDLPTSDDFTFELLTNKEMLACNENGVVGKLVSDHNNIEIWKTPNKNMPQKGWIGIFNRNGEAVTVKLTSTLLGFEGTAVSLQDVWNDKNLGTVSSSAPKEVKINAGGVLFCKYEIK
ncbi:glycoside hydrolase family 27 protein [Pedobacter sp. BS3]|uniref:glycoside hydrolase family 27 protein n=1 Tax=Pedobacter sp. BS3 TaxID=2567937 RepID=UPI0016594120|nr:glycoside hydrolase family 27 protein [Pedobacter sp. BS3]